MRGSRESRSILLTGAPSAQRKLANCDNPPLIRKDRVDEGGLARPRMSVEMF